MQEQTNYGSIKLHFSSAKKAMHASADGSCTAGQRARNGKVMTWIACVPKTSPTETTAQAIDRLRLQ